jgi:hypothetical protein
MRAEERVPNCMRSDVFYTVIGSVNASTFGTKIAQSALRTDSALTVHCVSQVRSDSAVWVSIGTEGTLHHKCNLYHRWQSVCRYIMYYRLSAIKDPWRAHP